MEVWPEDTPNSISARRWLRWRERPVRLTARGTDVTRTHEHQAVAEPIRFNVPYVGSAAASNVAQSFSSRAMCGDGPFTARATAALSALVGDRPTLADDVVHARARAVLAAARPA